MTTTTLIILKASNPDFAAWHTHLIKDLRVTKHWWVRARLIEAKRVWPLYTLHLRRHVTVHSKNACIDVEMRVSACLRLTKPLFVEAKATIKIRLSARMGCLSFVAFRHFAAAFAYCLGKRGTHRI